LGYVYSKSDFRKFHGVEQGNGIGSGGSRIGFMGEENLGGGLKALFKYEWGTAADVGTGATGARYSYVGLAGDFGQVTLGRNGSPSDLYLGATTPWGINGLEPVNQFRGKMGIIDGTRWDNSIAYASPKFSGLDLMGLYSFGEKTKASATDSTKFSDASKLGLGIRYANGPLYLSAVYQRLAEDKGAVVSGEKGWGIGGSYDFKVVKVYANYLRRKVDDTGLKDTAYSLGVGVPVSGAGTVVAEYARAKEKSSGFSGSSKGYSVGYRHNLSKRTSLYTYVSHFNNDEGISGGWTKTGIGGEKQTNFTVGISHYF
jgi:predicted porin